MDRSDEIGAESESGDEFGLKKTIFVESEKTPGE